MADRLKLLVPLCPESFTVSRLFNSNHICEKSLGSHKCREASRKTLLEPKHLLDEEDVLQKLIFDM